MSAPATHIPKRILPILVIAQFFCTSLWFAGNAIIGDIAKTYHIAPSYLGHLASAVQLGFIMGTLVFAVLGIADRFSPAKVFFVCALIAALANLAICLTGAGVGTLILFRAITGFFLAGIYPVGMKIASDYYQQGLGKSLGFLVGALVLGTAFPHLLKSLPSFPWQYVVYATSLLSVAGGLAIRLLVADGPYRKPAQQLNWLAFLKGFRNPKFRAATFGYIGHMWELYAFWVFVPVMLTHYQQHYPERHLPVSWLSFCIIAIGSLACVGSGLVSLRLGTKKTASLALGISCTCALLSPLVLLNSSLPLLLVFLLVWGMAVIADSPLFSTLVAQNASGESKGTALTIVNCIGFATTIASVQLINALLTNQNAQYIYMLLAIGPIFGLIALLRKN